MVDLAIVGHLGSPVYVGAIAIGGTVFNMLYWVFGFLRFGTSGLTAQAFGADSRGDVNLAGIRSLLIAAMIGAALIVLQYPLKVIAFAIINPDDATRIVAQSYYDIVIYGAPAVMMQYALTGWFVGVQNTRIPMFVSLFINVVNIAGSLLLAYVFNMGIHGVALGTVIAQWGGCIVALSVARFRLDSWANIWEISALRRFFSVNIDILLRTLCLISVTVWFTRSGASHGAVVLSVNALLMQMFTIFSYFMDGFAFAAEALCGKFYGASDFKGLRVCIRYFVRWGVVMAALFTVIYALFGSQIIAILTDDDSIRLAADTYHYWALMIPGCGFLAFIADGIAIGLTRTRMMLRSMALSTVLFFALYFLLSVRLENHALWIAFSAYLLGRGILLYSRLNKSENQR